jgi:oligopeptidase B
VLITYGTEWEIRVLRASEPFGDFRVLAPRRKGVRYWLAEEGGAFYLMENAAGASSRIARTPADGADASRWEDVLGSKRGWVVSDFDVPGGLLLAVLREGGLSRVQVLDPSTGKAGPCRFQSP